MKKGNLLFLPAAIRSHVLPSLYLANLLAEQYEIYYGVTNDILTELVTRNGYQAVRVSPWHVGYSMEGAYLASQHLKPTYWRLLRAYRRDELYHMRQRELKELVEQLKPVAIFIDLFICTDFWLLHKYNITYKLLFFNPMPSTYRLQGYPAVSEGYWYKDSQGTTTPDIIKRPKWTDWLLRPRITLMQQSIQWHRLRIQKRAQSLPDFPLATDASVTQVIANVPELLLAPQEFELSPEIRKPNQHYLGLCQVEDRHDTEQDAAFAAEWPELLANRLPGEKWVYCSFGTFHEGADAALLRFVTNLLDVVREWPGLRLVCSVNRYLIETLRARDLIPTHAHFFTRVPQLRVLAEADLFITHGGFGSIKESIYQGVPMLVYPLDPHYDQNGNALKVEHHGLGLRGLFAHERPEELKRKVKVLLEEDRYYLRVQQWREIMQLRYSSERLREALLVQIDTHQAERLLT
ncbi:glycosyltransferase [Telluribacter humicola]|uniref:glycosyltransferase n=1 Tax=Telluribacter humicola TaxID=1720261 RepID=UPI001A960E4B|nr:glycosyltransferase [Telluribacter humicola]